jgi:Fic family protein
VLEPNKGGIRKLPGTVILNDTTKEVVHTPPQSEQEIRDLLQNLEYYINENPDNFDPLIKMALIHFQFESIHPFYDGNGRTGRILNVLYLVLRGKINTPVLYLSKYIIDHKSEYYQHLKQCNENIENIPLFVLFILNAVIETSKATIDLIMRIDSLINITKEEMKIRLPEIYASEIVEHLFMHMVTKNSYFRESLSISRNTATRYLKALVEKGFLIEEPLGNEVLYKNAQLFNIFE